MAATLKSLVSKKRRRFQQGGFDLDLSYILDNLIAMGYPGEKIEGIHRNNIVDVTNFLEQKHQGHYKIYNLCEERTYNANKFKTGEVDHKYPFVDHNPPQIDFIPAFCKDVHDWLTKDKDNVAAVHCKAGKGRTGLMICCYLLHCHKCPTARAALESYAQKRTEDIKGVTIPSQQRYVGYYEHLLTQSPQVVYKPRPLILSKIRLDGHLVEHSKVIIQFTVRSSPSPDIVYTSSVIEWKHSSCGSGKKSGAVTTSASTSATSTSSSTDSHLHQPLAENTSTLSTSSTCGFYSVTNHLIIELEEPILLTGDVKLQIYTKPLKIMKKMKMCHAWFNSYFVDGIQQQSANQRGDRNGCNNSENGSTANCSANRYSSSSTKNGGCSVKKQDQTTITSSEAAVPQPVSSGILKRDSGCASDNCTTVKVKFTRDLQRSNRRSKQIDRTMSCPPPSDTTRPRLPAEWTSSFNKDSPSKPPDVSDQESNKTPTNSSSSKQQNHYIITFSKAELDKAHKDKGKYFSSDFAVHLILSDPSPSSHSCDYSSSSLSSHTSRSSFGGAGGGGSSSSSSNTTINQHPDVQVCMKKLNKMFPDHHHQPQRSSGGPLKTTRTASDVMAVMSSCIGADEDDNDGYVFGHEQQKGHRHRHHGVVGNSAGMPTDSGGVRLNRKHSSTSSCTSASSSSASCSENNSSCSNSNSSSTENCSQHHNNNKN